MLRDGDFEVVAFLFPGQGSHRPRMGERLLMAPWAEPLIQMSEEVTGLPLRQIILESPERLDRTEVAQPAILLVEWLAWEANHNKKPEAVAGHSLGEFAALSAAGVISWEVSTRLVALRGRLMANAHPGGMAAVIGLPPKKVEAIAEQAGCFVANYNAPEQTVISGEKKNLAQAASLATAQGGKVVPLPVAGAFHSPYMAWANEEFSAALADVPLRKPALPFISSVSGQLEADPNRILSLLSSQMISPVRWTAAIATLESMGVTCAVELGPGEVLTRLGRRITSRLRFHTLEEVMGDV